MGVDHERRPPASRGVVLRFDPDKGYGQIRRADGRRTIIVHQSAVERSGLIGLFPGQEVEFDLVPWGGYHVTADNLRLIAACAE
jgi:cold shock protein